MPPTSMSHFVRAMLARGHAERAPSIRGPPFIPDRADRGRAPRPTVPPARPFAEADERFIRALAIDEEEARAFLRAIGRAATVARERLAADAADQTA